jgi:hypothetical protein
MGAADVQQPETQAASHVLAQRSPVHLPEVQECEFRLFSLSAAACSSRASLPRNIACTFTAAASSSSFVLGGGFLFWAQQPKMSMSTRIAAPQCAKDDDDARRGEASQVTGCQHG